MFFFFFSFIFAFVSAYEMGITPPSLALETSPGREVCEEFTLILDKKISEEIEIKFSEKESKKVPDYIYSAEDLEVEFDFDELDEEDGRKVYEFCLTPTYSGEHHALIIAKAEGKNVAVGMWVAIDVSGKKFIPSLPEKNVSGKKSTNQEKEDDALFESNLITGLATSPEGKINNKSIIWLAGSSVFLLIVFLGLLYFSLQKKKKPVE